MVAATQGEGALLPMTRWLVTGAHGGSSDRDLVRVLGWPRMSWPSAVARAGHHRRGCRERRQSTPLRPDVIMNAAAYTAVDAAESESRGTASGQRGRARRTSPRMCGHRRSRWCRSRRTTSSPEMPTSPTPKMRTPGPDRVYGRTKLAGERAVARRCRAHYVVRTAWLYGETGNNFVKTMMRLERERETVQRRGRPARVTDLVTGRRVGD